MLRTCRVMWRRDRWSGAPRSHVPTALHAALSRLSVASHTSRTDHRAIRVWTVLGARCSELGGPGRPTKKRFTSHHNDIFLSLSYRDTITHEGQPMPRTVGCRPPQGGGMSDCARMAKACGGAAEIVRIVAVPATPRKLSPSNSRSQDSTSPGALPRRLSAVSHSSRLPHDDTSRLLAKLMRSGQTPFGNARWSFVTSCRK